MCSYSLYVNVSFDFLSYEYCYRTLNINYEQNMIDLVRILFAYSILNQVKIHFNICFVKYLQFYTQNKNIFSTNVMKFSPSVSTENTIF